MSNKISRPKITPLGPQRIPDARAKRGAPAIYELDTLKIGDCVQVEGKSFGAVSAAIWRYQRKHPERFRVREVRSLVSGRRSVVKIWRVL